MHEFQSSTRIYSPKFHQYHVSICVCVFVCALLLGAIFKTLSPFWMLRTSRDNTPLIFARDQSINTSIEPYSQYTYAHCTCTIVLDRDLDAKCISTVHMNTRLVYLVCSGGFWVTREPNWGKALGVLKYILLVEVMPPLIYPSSVSIRCNGNGWMKKTGNCYVCRKSVLPKTKTGHNK